MICCNRHNPSKINESEALHVSNYSTISSNLKRGILSFSKTISKGLTRPEFKFVSQMIYGMLCKQNCHLSNIARALDEPITIKKTIDRLSRNLAAFSKAAELLNNYVKKIKGCLSDRTILIVDDSDIVKPCSKKMEALHLVRDGSTGDYGMGYHTLAVTALTTEHKAPIGVYTRVYSVAEDGFISADEETLKALRFIRKHFRRNNIRAFDRGYDANVYYMDLIDHKEKFVIRATKNRNVIYKGETINIAKLAERFKGKYSLKYKKKNSKQVDCKISIVPIRLCCRPNEELNLVVCRNFGQDPMMLITNMKSDDDRLAVTVTKVYLMRWRIEEFYGFKKQQFAFEDFRVRSLNSIRNLDLLLTVAIGYIGMLSERAEDKRIVMELIHISKRIYSVPKFKFYAIADGICAVLANGKQGISRFLTKRRRCAQLCLFPELLFSTA